jgi:hypothetical protein
LSTNEIAKSVPYTALYSGFCLYDAIVSFLASNQAIQSSMFRRSIWEKVGGYDEKTSVGFFEEWDFWILLTSQGWTIGVIPELLLKYRRFGNSNQDNAMKNFDVVLEYYVNRHKALYEKYLTEIIILLFLTFIMWIAITLIKL